MRNIVLVIFFCLISSMAHAYTPLIDCASDGSHALTSTANPQKFFCTSVTGGGGGTVTLGTSTSAANPQISGDATTGFYTAGAGLVDTVISGTKRVEVSSTGQTITGTSTANSFIPTGTSIPSLGLYTSAANHVTLSANSQPVIDGIGTASAVDYLQATNSATGNPGLVSLNVVGTDTNIHYGVTTKGTGGYLITSSGNNSLAVGPNGSTTPIFQVDSSVASANGGIRLTGISGSGTVTFNPQGTGTNIGWSSTMKGSGNWLVNTVTGSLTLQAGSVTYETIQIPSTTNASIVDGGSAAHTLPIGTTGTRPSSGVNGMVRYNSTTPALEGYLNNMWQSLDMTPETQGFVYNPAPAKAFTKLAAAINRVKANTGNAVWLELGTSTVSGYCSGVNGVNPSWQQSQTMEQLIANYLVGAYGLGFDAAGNPKAQNDSIFGYPVSDGTGRVTADSRLIVGTGWGASATISAGGPMFVNTTTTVAAGPLTTNSISISIPAYADKVVIVTPQDAGLGTISYRVNAGSSTNIVEAGTAAAILTTVTLTPGAGNKLNIDRVSGTANVIGVYFYLSTTSQLLVFNMGYGGVTAAGYLDASGKPYASPAIYSALSPDFADILMDNNDAIANTASATYKANIQSLYNQLTNADVLLQSQVAYGAGAGTIANIAAKITDLQALTVTNTTAFFNNYQRYGGVGGYTNLSSNNMSCIDDLHGSQSQYQEVAQATALNAMLLAGFDLPTKSFSAGGIGATPQSSSLVYKPSPLSIGIGNLALATSGFGANTAQEGNNVAIGDQALQSVIPVTSTSGMRNNAFGYQALNLLTTGTRNNVMGWAAGSILTTGSNNTILGHNVAGTTLQTGSSNILIGTSNGTDTAAGSTSNTIQVGGSGGAWVLVTGTDTNTTAITAMHGNITLPEVATGTNADFVCMSSGNKLTLQTSACTISSRRFKENIADYEGSAIKEIMKLRTVSFNMKDMERPNADPNFKAPQLGLIAEELADVDGRLAIYEDDMKTPKSYRQEAVIALLIKAVQEQQQQIDELKGKPVNDNHWWHKIGFHK